MRLSNVTLNEAMAVILEAVNAQMEISGNIIRIVPSGEGGGPTEERQLVTEIFTPRFVNSGRLVTVLTPLLTPKGRIQTFHPGINEDPQKPETIIVTDLPENIDDIRKLIEQLDVEMPQVFIEAKLVETALSNNELLGVDWNINASLQGSPVKFDSIYAKGGSIEYGTLSMSGFQALLDLLKTRTDTNVLSDVKTAAVDGVPANIHVGETLPVGLTTIGSGTVGGTAFGTTGIREYEVGVILDVTPTVMGDNMIYMKVEPKISKITGFSSLGGGQSNAPITTTRSVQTQIMVRDGETIVIGGLIQDLDTEARKKFPILGDLPLVGSAFRKKNKNIEKSNLYIFVTAHIMDTKTKKEISEKANSAGATVNTPSENK